MNTYFYQVNDRDNDKRCLNRMFNRIGEGGHLGGLGVAWSCLEGIFLERLNKNKMEMRNQI